MSERPFLAFGIEAAKPSGFDIVFGAATKPPRFKNPKEMQDFTATYCTLPANKRLLTFKYVLYTYAHRATVWVCGRLALGIAVCLSAFVDLCEPDEKTKAKPFVTHKSVPNARLRIIAIASHPM